MAEDDLAAPDVEWVYETLLGRKPESEQVIQHHLNMFTNLKDLVRAFIGTGEFKHRTGADFLRTFDVVLYKRTKYGFWFPIPLWNADHVIAHAATDYEESETGFVLSNLAEGDLCVDLGVRFGWFTCAMATRVGPTGSVVGFDPTAAGTDLLWRALEINKFENVLIHSVAVGDRPRKVYLNPDFTVRPLNTLSTVESTQEVVDMVQLDEFLAARDKPVRVIKMDIEGGELLALRGAARLLKEDQPAILTEVNVELLNTVSETQISELLKFITHLGYAPVEMGGTPISVDDVVNRASAGHIFNLGLLPINKSRQTRRPQVKPSNTNSLCH